MEAANGVIFEANERLLAMTGYSLAEVMDTPIHMYVVDDPGNVERYLDQLRTGGVLTPEIRYIRHKNGRKIPVERTGALIAHKGRQMVLITLRDLSEERRLQEQIQTDVQLAGKMQRMLMPPDYSNAWIAVRTVFEPHRLVSGDYFDYRWDEQSKVLQGYVLDITGHGMGAVLQAVSVGGRLGEMMDRGRALGPVVLQELDKEINSYFPDESFAGVLVFELDILAGHLTVGTGGINRFLASSICHNGLMELPGSYVGLAPCPDFNFKTLAVQPGDSFYFMTDGLYERISECLPADMDDFEASTATMAKLAKETSHYDDSSGLFIRIVSGPVLPLRFSFSTRQEWLIICRRLRRIFSGMSDNEARIAVALNEAVNNALEHGTGQCWVTVDARRGKRCQWLRICVSNEGDGFAGNDLIVDGADPEGRKAEGATPDAVAERGRGMKMMAALMDRVKYNAAGTEVRMLKKCGYHEGTSGQAQIRGE